VEEIIMDSYVFRLIKQISIISIIGIVGYVMYYFYELSYLTYFGVPTNLVQVEFKDFTLILVLIGILLGIHFLIYLFIVIPAIEKFSVGTVLVIVKIILTIPILLSFYVFGISKFDLITFLFVMVVDIVYTFIKFRKIGKMKDISKQIADKTVDKNAEKGLSTMSTFISNFISIFIFAWILTTLTLPFKAGEVIAKLKTGQCKNEHGFMYIRSYRDYSIFVKYEIPNNKDRILIETQPTNNQKILCE
jgi:hypothetical protein